MKVTFWLSVFLFVFFHLNGQWRPSPANLFEEAEDYFLIEEYNEALTIYLRLHQQDLMPGFILYRIGVCYLNMPGQEYKSLVPLENASKNISVELRSGSVNEKNSPADAIFFLGIAYRYSNKLEKAIESFERFIKISKDPILISRAETELEKTKTAQLLIKNAQPIRTEEVIGKTGLTTKEENIVISGDEKTIAFISPQKFYNAVFYKRLENNLWSKPRNITPQIGSDGDIYPLSLSYDGNTMLLYRYESESNGDIFISRLENERWSKIERLPSPVNSDYYESYASLSSDGKTMYFSSNRPGGFGGLDIYKSKMDDYGNWGPALNLGPQVNSMGNEITPFLTKDSKYLFFSSEGHLNMGGFDVFYSERLDDDLWSQAKNLGYPINTTGDDKFFMPVGYLPGAYYSFLVDQQHLTREFLKLSNIFGNHEVRVNVAIQVINKWKDLTTSPITLTLSDARIQKPIEIFPNIPHNGTKEITLEPGYYGLSVTNEKYFPVNAEFTIEQYYPDSKMEITLELIPVPVELKLHHLYFKFDSYELVDAEKEKLQDLISFLSDYQGFQIELSGFTDISGDKNYNKMLAAKRVEAISEYLSSQGIDQERINQIAVGPENFIATNNVIEGRKFNRRVEVKIFELPDFITVTHLIDIPENLQFKKY